MHSKFSRVSGASVIQHILTSSTESNLLLLYKVLLSGARWYSWLIALCIFIQIVSAPRLAAGQGIVEEQPTDQAPSAQVDGAQQQLYLPLITMDSNALTASWAVESEAVATAALDDLVVENGPEEVSAAVAGQRVTVLFYNRAGQRLSPAAVRSLSNNGTLGFDNDALIDPNTLQVIRMGPLTTVSGNLGFTTLATPVALAFNWPTTRGYSLVVVDNGGIGYSNTKTVNFTYQAALDGKRRLDAARQARTDYQPSAAFQNAYNSLTTHLQLAQASTSQTVRGKEGYLALDDLNLAYDLLLSEYGVAYTKNNLATRSPWLGVTLETSNNYQARLNLAAQLTNPYGWVRIVFDPAIALTTYQPVVAYAKAKGLKILGEPVDSYYDRQFTRAQYLQRFQDYVTAFPTIDAWEVGNEVNGSWLNSNAADSIALKVADVAAYVKATAPNSKTVLTLFWQLNTDRADTAMFNWVRANLPSTVRSNLDVVLISQYIEQAPMGLAFDSVMQTLQQEFPTQHIGLGELGYWLPGQRQWWAFNPSTRNQADPVGRRLTASQYYPAALAYPNSVGGGFWWNFEREFPNDAELQGVLSGLRNALLDTNSANTHSGSWAARGVLTATASYKDLYQAVANVAPNVTYVAKLWIKGSGAIRLNVWNNAWTTPLSQTQCIASTQWTECTSAPFNTGNHTALYFDLETAFNGAGTVYADDLFLGESNGINQLLNPGFESGNTVWERNNPTPWTILQNP